MKLWEGRRYVLLTALVLDILALVTLIIAFITPYWYVTWPRVYSGFRRIGLWEVCFYGLLIPRDPNPKSYHGCWWILAPEFWNIRSWIMPPWFIIVQILITVCLCIEVFNFVLDILVWLRTSKRDKAGIGRRRAPFRFVQAGTIIVISTSVMKVFSVIIFGLGAEFDINWLPPPVYPAYPHVSYGLAIVSAFMSIFSSMAHQVFRSDVRRDYMRSATGDPGDMGGGQF